MKQAIRQQTLVGSSTSPFTLPLLGKSWNSDDPKNGSRITNAPSVQLVKPESDTPATAGATAAKKLRDDGLRSADRSPDSPLAQPGGALDLDDHARPVGRGTQNTGHIARINRTCDSCQATGIASYIAQQTSECDGMPRHKNAETSSARNKGKNLETIADRVRRLRRAKKLSQTELGRLSGLSQVTISDIERGRNKGSRELHHIAEALGVTPYYLETGRESQGSVKSHRISYAPMSGPVQHADVPTVRVGLLGENGAVDKIGAVAPVRSVELAQAWAHQNFPGMHDASGITLLHCLDDSMTPTFSRGDVLLLDTAPKSVDIDGIYAYVLRHNFYIKRLQRMPEGGLRVISDNNAFYPPIDMSEGDRQLMSLRGRIVYSWSGRRI